MRPNTGGSSMGRVACPAPLTTSMRSLPSSPWHTRPAGRGCNQCTTGACWRPGRHGANAHRWRWSRGPQASRSPRVSVAATGGRRAAVARRRSAAPHGDSSRGANLGPGVDRPLAGSGQRSADLFEPVGRGDAAAVAELGRRLGGSPRPESGQASIRWPTAAHCGPTPRRAVESNRHRTPARSSRRCRAATQQTVASRL
jgi:hypothetical protein